MSRLHTNADATAIDGLDITAGAVATTALQTRSC